MAVKKILIIGTVLLLSISMVSCFSKKEGNSVTEDETVSSTENQNLSIEDDIFEDDTLEDDIFEEEFNEDDESFADEKSDSNNEEEGTIHEQEFSDDGIGDGEGIVLPDDEW